MPTTRPDQPHPERRRSLFTPRPDTELGAPDPDVSESVGRELVHRVLSEGPRAEIAHLVVLALVMVLLWGSVSHALLWSWAGIIALLTIGRGFIRRRLLTSPLPVPASLRRIRVVLAMTGLFWGVGAAACMPDLAPHEVGLLLVVLSGLAAGGIATLVADLWSYRYFLAGLLTPLPVGLLSGPLEEDGWVAVILVALFGAAMTVFHRRSYQELKSHLLESAQALRDRAYLDALLAGAPIALAIIGADKRIVGVNAKFESLFGYSKSEAVGQNLNELIVAPAERAVAEQLEVNAARGDIVVTEVTRLHRTGRAVPVRVSAAQVREAEGGLLVLYEDITERRQAEQAREHAERALRDAERHYRELVESATDLVWQVDREGRWTYLNAAAEDVYGIAPRDLLGRPFFEVVDPAYVDQSKARFADVLSGQTLTELESVHRDATGAPKHLSISARPQRDSQGEVVGAHGTAHDVTARARTEQALRDARDAAERLAKARSAFLANMSHEIRTPMNAILGLTELLLDTELAPEQRHSLLLVQTSAETLLTLINDILDLSKIESEHLQLESIAFDLPHLVESTMSLLAVRARERRLELLADVPHDTPATARGDPTRLRQVLTNLIGNAIKFTHRGEVVVSAARVGDADGRTLVRFAVRDTGIGIPAEKLDTIFQEFTQADASMTRKYGGTGLGLAICQRLVRLMGGELAVSSEVGAGTEFSFTIPLETEARAPTAAGLAHGGLQLVGQRALVVDDNATNRRIVRDMLEASGVYVDEAPDGATAIAALRRGREEGQAYDVAMLDVQMPEQDGFQLAAAIRADPQIADTRLLVLTSAGQRGDGQRCRDLGIGGYLAKPASRSDLLQAVGALLGAPLASGPSAATALITRHTIAESRKRLRILLAEDNPVNQEVAASMLRKRGHIVDVVGDGREAVDAVTRASYDMILMDIQMPHMDGFEATHAIRALPVGRDLPIIALTAHALTGERDRCLSHGMSGYIPKPFKAHELFATIEGWTGMIAPTAEVSLPEPDSAPPVDLESFREQMRAAGAEAVVDSILDTFLRTAQERITALTDAFESGSAREIDRAAHAFKSASGTIGAKGLAALLQQVEAAGKAGDVAAARALRERFEQESHTVLDYLRAARAGAPNG